MFSPFMFPLVVFSVVVLILAIASFARIRDAEIEVQQRLYQAEMAHQRKLQELERELERVKEGS